MRPLASVRTPALAGSVHRLALILCLGCVALFGCGRRAEDTPPSPAGASEAAANTHEAPRTPTAHVRGVVRLVAGAELPEYPLAAVGQGEDRPEIPEGCSRRSASDTRPMRLSEDRGIGGLLVTATGDEASFRGLPALEARRIPVAIHDCRLEPRLVVAAVGDELVVSNDSAYAFLTKFTTNPINEALPHGRERILEVTRPGVQVIECSLVAGCGRTEVVVLGHRVAIVTDRDGRFELDIPAGNEVILHAWHPLFGPAEAVARVTLAPGESSDVVLELTPRVARPPAPTVDTPSSGPEGGQPEFH